MYSLTYKGRTRKVSGSVFWSLALPVVAVAVLMLAWAGWMVYLSNAMLSDLTHIPWVLCALVVLVLLSSITVNGEEKAILPSQLRTGLGLLLVWGTVYYQFAVQHWGLGAMALLVTPLVSFKLYALYRLVRK